MDLPRRTRRAVAVAIVCVAVLALIAAMTLSRDLRAWLVTGLVGAAASLLAVWIARLADTGLTKGREIALGRANPLTVSVTPEIGPYMEIGDASAPRRTTMAAYQQKVKLIIEAAVPGAVVLTDMRVIIVSRDDPLRGEVWAPAYAVDLREFNVDLDEERPRPVPQHGTPPFPFAVSPQHPEVFLVIARTERHHVTWRLALDWTYSGRSGTTLISNPVGLPFQVTAAPSQRPGG